jgi:hypothetical protein
MMTANSYLYLVNAMDNFDAFADDRAGASFRQRPSLRRVAAILVPDSVVLVRVS